MLFAFGLPAAAVTDDAPVDFRRVLLTGRLVTHVALPVEPGVPVPGVHLQDRLEFATATIDAALHEGHEDSPSVLRQFEQYHGAGAFTGFGLRFRHLAQR